MQTFSNPITNTKHVTYTMFSVRGFPRVSFWTKKCTEYLHEKLGQNFFSCEGLYFVLFYHFKKFEYYFLLGFYSPLSRNLRNSMML